YAVHFLEYAVLGVLLFRATRQTWGMPHGVSSIFAVSSSFIYGMMMEIAQRFLPYRSFSVEDMVVDLAGAIAGLLVLRSLRQ
ncbi:MAG TPA: VanZ family protein, partial [Anaerolineae bacterium]|nr:VanZ family protein [Anaerolineae bacterium]